MLKTAGDTRAQMEKTLFNIQYVILGNVMRELYEVRADNYDWGKNCIMAHQNSFNLICKLLQAIFLAGFMLSKSDVDKTGHFKG